MATKTEPSAQQLKGWFSQLQSNAIQNLFIWLPLYSPNDGLDEAVGWSLVPSHCMTTSRPAAAMQMRVRECPAMHPKLFLCQMPFLPQTSLFLGLGTGSHTETSRCTEIYFTSELVCYEISPKCYTAHISVTHFNNSGTFLHVNLTTCLTITLTLLLTSFNFDKISRAKPSASPRFVPTATHATSVTTLCNIMYATYMLQWYYEISDFVKSLVILCNYWNLLTVITRNNWTQTLQFRKSRIT